MLFSLNIWRIKKNSVPLHYNKTIKKMESYNRYIIVCTEGFVHVGTWTDQKDNDGYHIVKDSSIIRRWGTEKGLGQLATEGVLKDTVLDYEGVIAINPLHLIRKIICVAKI